MRLVRSAAQKLSRMVVRYASPGCKEWAQGLAREADFIQSDWKALAWALGSMRVLLVLRHTPIRSLDDVVRLARKSAAAKWIVGFGCGFAVLNGALNLTQFFGGRVISVRIGHSLVGAAWMLIGFNLFKEVRARKKLLAAKTVLDIAHSYKAELERQLNAYRSSSNLWIGACGGACMIVGQAMVLPLSMSFGLLVSLCLELMVIGVIVLYGRRNARRKLEEVTALLKTGS
jgi:hypothetical protein